MGGSQLRNLPAPLSELLPMTELRVLPTQRRASAFASGDTVMASAGYPPLHPTVAAITQEDPGGPFPVANW